MGGRGRLEELSNSASPRVPCQSRPPPVTCRGFNAFSLALGCAAVSKQVKFICHHNITRAIKTSSVQLLQRNRATPRVVEVVRILSVKAYLPMDSIFALLKLRLERLYSCDYYLPYSLILGLLSCFSVGTDRPCPHILRSRVYVTVRCTSASIFVPIARRRTPLLRVCCCGPGEHNISIDCCPARSSTALSSKCGQATLSADV